MEFAGDDSDQELRYDIENLSPSTRVSPNRSQVVPQTPASLSGNQSSARKRCQCSLPTVFWRVSPAYPTVVKLHDELLGPEWNKWCLLTFPSGRVESWYQVHARERRISTLAILGCVTLISFLGALGSGLMLTAESDYLLLAGIGLILSAMLMCTVIDAGMTTVDDIELQSPNARGLVYAYEDYVVFSLLFAILVSLYLIVMRTHSPRNVVLATNQDSYVKFNALMIAISLCGLALAISRPLKQLKLLLLVVITELASLIAVVVRGAPTDPAEDSDISLFSESLVSISCIMTASIPLFFLLEYRDRAGYVAVWRMQRSAVGTKKKYLRSRQLFGRTDVAISQHSPESGLPFNSVSPGFTELLGTIPAEKSSIPDIEGDKTEKTIPTVGTYWKEENECSDTYNSAADQPRNTSLNNTQVSTYHDRAIARETCNILNIHPDDIKPFLTIQQKWLYHCRRRQLESENLLPGTDIDGAGTPNDIDGPPLSICIRLKSKNGRKFRCGVVAGADIDDIHWNLANDEAELLSSPREQDNLPIYRVFMVTALIHTKYIILVWRDLADVLTTCATVRSLMLLESKERKLSASDYLEKTVLSVTPDVEDISKYLCGVGELPKESTMNAINSDQLAKGLGVAFSLYENRIHRQKAQSSDESNRPLPDGTSCPESFQQFVADDFSEIEDDEGVIASQLYNSRMVLLRRLACKADELKLSVENTLMGDIEAQTVLTIAQRSKSLHLLSAVRKLFAEIYRTIIFDVYSSSEFQPCFPESDDLDWLQNLFVGYRVPGCTLLHYTDSWSLMDSISSVLCRILRGVEAFKAKDSIELAGDNFGISRATVSMVIVSVHSVLQHLLGRKSRMQLHYRVNSEDDGGVDALYYVEVVVLTSCTLNNSCRNLILTYLQCLRNASIYSILFEDSESLITIPNLSTRLDFVTSMLALFSIGGVITLENSEKTSEGLYRTMKILFPIQNLENGQSSQSKKNIFWRELPSLQHEVSHPDLGTFTHNDEVRRASSIRVNTLEEKTHTNAIAKSANPSAIAAATAKCAKLLSMSAIMYIDEKKKGNRKTVELIARKIKVTCNFAEPGESALAYFSHDDSHSNTRAIQPVKVVILDVSGLTDFGSSFISKLRAAGFAGPVMSLHHLNATKAEEEECLHAGATIALEKPITLEKICDAIIDGLEGKHS